MLVLVWRGLGLPSTTTSTSASLEAFVAVCATASRQADSWQRVAQRTHTPVAVVSTEQFTISCSLHLPSLALMKAPLFCCCLCLRSHPTKHTEVINGAIISGRATAGAFGVRLNQASDTTAAAMAYLSPLVRTPAAAAELMGTSSTIALPFQPLCPPVCLNLGSFAKMLRSASCVCGSAKLNTISEAASEGVRVGGVALAGAVIMYVGASMLLMILTGQYVTAKYDRAAARVRQQRDQRDYENGYLADPRDCVGPVTSTDEAYYVGPDVHPRGAAAGGGVRALDLTHKISSPV